MKLIKHSMNLFMQNPLKLHLLKQKHRSITAHTEYRLCAT
jgi:hypothetical protein